MLKFLSLFLLIAAVSAREANYRHLWQQNAAKLGLLNAPSDRIVGGIPTPIQQVPHQIALHMRGNFRCGGSVIDEVTILSAAHCTHPNPYDAFQIRAGTDQRSQGILHQVSRLYDHPQYDDWTLDHDICIMKLSTPLIEGPNLRRAQLPTPNYFVPAGYQAVVSGWGDEVWGDRQPTEQLQSTRVTVMTNLQCQALYPSYVIHPFHICAGDYGHDACQGDSGGPLTRNFGLPNGMVIGVVNWGYYCGWDWPTVYSRVSYYLDWIQPLMG